MLTSAFAARTAVAWLRTQFFWLDDAQAFDIMSIESIWVGVLPYERSLRSPSMASAPDVKTMPKIRTARRAALGLNIIVSIRWFGTAPNRRQHDRMRRRAL